ncbi:MAG TPA: MerR family transcriptional regulator [Cytophagaceae bacterium]|jgi:DNA-binding transcriptional MerR regulator|nr:MerR family transcriptional regulator [Cytophagaceae bacterium]
MNTKHQLDSFLVINSLDEAKAMLDFLQQPLFHIKDLGLSQRVVMHWDNYGLLNIKRDNNDEWRKFNFVDYVWIHIIQELRTMGVPLEIIKKSKATVLGEIHLEWMIKDIENNIDEIKKINEAEKINLKNLIQNFRLKEQPHSIKLPFLLKIIADIIYYKRTLSLLVFSDGFTLPLWEGGLNGDYPTDIVEKITFETHIIVSIPNIIRKFITSEKSAFILPKLNILEENEQQLLDLIQSGDYEKIIINFKNKKMKTMKLTKQHDTKKKVVDVIMENSFQDIELVIHKGKIMKIKNTKKIIFE